MADTVTGDTITTEQIAEVRAAADAEGNTALVRWCDIATDEAELASRRRKARAIVAAAYNALQDGGLGSFAPDDEAA